MADLQKFLNQEGVSTLWTRIAEELAVEVARAKAAEEANAAAAKAAQDEVDALETLVGVLPEGTTATTIVEYVNKKTEGIATDSALAELQAQVTEHENSLAVLEGDAETAGSVANVAKAAAVAEVASIVAGADAKFDTLKEIADWIANDTTGAASMANDISTLEELVGDLAVATQIANAIDAALLVEGVEKYALATDLTALTNRVKALEDAGHVTQAAIDAGVKEAKNYADSLAANYDAAGTAEAKANAALTSAKAYTDEKDTAMNARVAVLEAVDHSKFEAAGAAAQALIDAKAYTDTEINTKIIALTEAEIDQAIANAKAAAQV